MIARAREVKRLYRDSLLARENVVACGVGYKEIGGQRTDEVCVVVSVVRKMPKKPLCLNLGDCIPSILEGVRTDVQETGVIWALQAPIDRWRPAPGGVSIGHKDITAGTLGCLVTRGGEWFILSNNHVLAASNQGKVGDEILQPGKVDGGTVSADTLATLWDFVPVKFLFDQLPDCPTATGVAKAVNLLARLVRSKHRVRAYQDNPLATNLVDAAIARPIKDSFVEHRILEIGTPIGVAEGVLGLPVQKSGRTTGLTTGVITQIDVSVQVTYPPSSIAVFEDQLMAGEMCAGGDSGSVVLDMERHVVGLLFAGGEGVTIFNRIQNVMSALDVVI